MCVRGKHLPSILTTDQLQTESYQFADRHRSALLACPDLPISNDFDNDLGIWYEAASMLWIDPENDIRTKPVDNITMSYSKSKYRCKTFEIIQSTLSANV